MRKINSTQKNKGFTLIELLVSIALFSIVVTITISSIVTIVDANKKARSLMTVMNNLNMAVDAISRSFTMGINPSQNNNCFSTDEVDNSKTTSAKETERQTVTYCLKTEDNKRKITKQIEEGNPFDLTSSDINIDTTDSFFKIVNPNGEDGQPILFMVLSGEVRISPKINSSFRIQTTANQRRLQVDSKIN